MKLLAFLLTILPTALVRSAFTYGTEIGSFTFSWTNPDAPGDSGTSTLTGPADGTLFTDSDLTTGETLGYPGVQAKTWGIPGDAGTQGMVGSFEATTLTPPANKLAYSITAASITFDAGCFSSIDSTANAYYYDLDGNRVIIATTTSTFDANGYATFSADITTGLTTNGAIGFEISSNKYCEGGIEVTEFSLDGTEVDTESPTQAPTTAAPTMAPTKQCKGEVTWGDPHYTLMAMSTNARQRNYQGSGQYRVGWYHYIYPCDSLNQEAVDQWPFYLMAYHRQCNGAKACIENNRMVLNTKPDPWIIEFSNSAIDVTVGTDLTYSTGDFASLSINDVRTAPITIEYSDAGDPNDARITQSGKLVISWDRNLIVLTLYDVAFTGYPRTCNKGANFGAECGAYSCDGEVIQVDNRGSFTTFSCPTCLRNIACGLMGKYTRGDCSNSDLANPNSACYNIMKGSDGVTYTPPTNDNVFGQMAVTWSKLYIDSTLSVNPNFHKHHAFSSSANGQNFAPKMMNMAAIEGRSVTIEDASYYDGDCKDDIVKIAAVNETCRVNTVVKYAKCCKEIGGICEVLWSACIEDFCACTDPANDPVVSEADCLYELVHESMNATCSIDRFYPTATPTSAPTPSPVGLIPGLPKGKKAEDLIWVYLIFVVLFVIIAGAAYWYYRKKSGGKYVMDDEDEVGMQAVTVPSAQGGATYTQD